MSALAPTLQAFFTDRLIRQRQASRHTIAAYRDTCGCCWLRRAAHRQAALPAGHRRPRRAADRRVPRPPRNDRGNSARTRNARLAAIHSLFRYAALRHPEHAAVIARVLAIPPKRFDQALVTYLTEHEIDALLAAPDHSHLDRPPRPRPALLACPDRAARLRTHRPDHAATCTSGTGATSAASAKAANSGSPRSPPPPSPCCAAGSPNAAASPTDPLFPTRRGTPLSRDALERRIAKHAATAAQHLPDPARQERSPPHILRHSAAMRLLHAGVDTTVIALWLGHERSRPPRSTSTPTSPSKRRRWPGPHRQDTSPAATSPPTRCWPSSTAC